MSESDSRDSRTDFELKRSTFRDFVDSLRSGDERAISKALDSTALSLNEWVVLALLCAEFVGESLLELRAPSYADELVDSVLTKTFADRFDTSVTLVLKRVILHRDYESLNAISPGDPLKASLFLLTVCLVISDRLNGHENTVSKALSVLYPDSD